MRIMFYNFFFALVFKLKYTKVHSSTVLQDNELFFLFCCWKKKFFLFFLCFITGLYIKKNVVYHHSLIIELTVCSFKNDSFKTYTIYFFSWSLNYKRLNFFKKCISFSWKIYIVTFWKHVFIYLKYLLHIHACNAYLWT